MKASKLVNNDNNWLAVSGLAQTGIFVSSNSQNNKSYSFGLEEWNNSVILRKQKLAYIDSFRSFPREQYYERIELLNFINGILYHVGRLENVKRIKCKEIPDIKTLLTTENWLNQVEIDFHNIDDLREIENHQEYMKCWNSEEIVAPTNQGFIVNIRYDKLIFFENPINITALNANSNNLWRRLAQLYEVSNDLENLFN